MSVTRSQHYTFAHGVTPEAFFREPTGFVATLRSPQGIEIVTNVWNAIGADIVEAGLGEAIPPDGLSVTTTELSGRYAAVISLPPPQMLTEAWFVAVVAPGEDDGAGPRYFTLEKTVAFAPDGDLDVDADLAVMCEWTAEGTHLNLGAQVPPNLEQFEIAVLDRLGGRDR